MTHFEGKQELSEALATAIERDTAAIEAISREIFDHPETAFEEQRASSLLTDYLSGLGYAVETGIAGLPTAFVARLQNYDSEAMRKGLRHGHVAILAEYDAGDEGHIYGRHLTAGGALAIAAGMKAVLADMHGAVSIIGCPAATTLEGKRILAEAGVFEEPDLVMGAMPASSGVGFQTSINNTGDTIATARVAVRFAGDAGESDARQRMATAVESADIATADGDSLQTSLSEGGVEFILRSTSNQSLDAMIAALRELAGTVALDTASTADVSVAERVPAMIVNRILSRRVKTYVDNMGLVQDRIRKVEPAEPSDWAYPSMVAATTIARYPVSEADPVEMGTPAFAEASVSTFAFKQLVSAALGVSITALDTLGDMDFRGFAEGELIRTLKAQGVQRTPRRWLGVHPVMPREGSNGQPPALGPLSRPRRG